jgi:hypothetical protein
VEQNKKPRAEKKGERGGARTMLPFFSPFDRERRQREEEGEEKEK